MIRIVKMCYKLRKFSVTAIMIIVMSNGDQLVFWTACVAF